MPLMGADSRDRAVESKVLHIQLPRLSCEEYHVHWTKGPFLVKTALTHFFPEFFLVFGAVGLVYLLQLCLGSAAQDLNKLLVIGAQAAASFLHDVCGAGSDHGPRLLYIVPKQIFAKGRADKDAVRLMMIAICVLLYSSSLRVEEQRSLNKTEEHCASLA